MGKHERVKDKAKPVSSDEATPQPKMALADNGPKLDLPTEKGESELPKLEAPKLDVQEPVLPKPEVQPAIDLAKIEAAIAEPAAIATPKIELASIAAPRIVPDMEEDNPAGMDAVESAPQAVADEAAQESTHQEPPAEAPAPRVNRFTLLAAALALSAGLGGMVGVIAAASFMRGDAAPSAVAGRTGLEEFQALKESVVQARVDLAAMKASIDAGNRNAGAQLTKLGERIDRMERSQAEPVAKLSKAIDTLDRMSRADAAAQARDVTGSITPPASSVPPAVAAAARPGAGGLDGWVVRDVRRGTALIEGRMGIIEVDQGDIVPGLGRVDAIRKQPDGRWVVVTTRGLITSAR